MKVLFLRRKGEGTIAAARHFHDFEQEVGKLVDGVWAGKDWPLYRADEPLEATITRVMPDVDWVIDRERNVPLPRNRDYNVACYLSDLHGRGGADIRNDPKGHLDIVNQIGYDIVFLKYEEIHFFDLDPRIFMTDLEPKTVFLPWSVSDEEFKPKKTKLWDITFIGTCRARVYPLRGILDRELHGFCEERGLRLLFSKRTRGTATFTNQQLYKHRGFYFGPRYADALSKTRFFIFGCSIYRYPLVKYFEAAASGCVVVANEPSSAEKLGFIDGETYVCVTNENWRDKLDYYLEHPEEADRIAANARSLILERHTHKIRAKQFVKHLKEFE